MVVVKVNGLVDASDASNVVGAANDLNMFVLLVVLGLAESFARDAARFEVKGGPLAGSPKVNEVGAVAGSVIVIVVS